MKIQARFNLSMVRLFDSRQLADRWSTVRRQSVVGSCSSQLSRINSVLAMIIGYVGILCSQFSTSNKLVLYNQKTGMY